ncbi:MAG TPA: glycine cleavage system protein H [Verrucomicrobiae bacterium]
MAAEQSDALAYQRARFATRLPLGYLYSPGHYWIGRQEEHLWRVGFTKFGSRMLGEMVDYGFDTEVGSPIRTGQVIGWIEGFKALSEVFCVGGGQFGGANPALEDDPTVINRDPYDAGWLYLIRGEPDSTCIDVHAYAELLNRTIDKLLERSC